MGRTRRKRNSKCNSFKTCENRPEVILLNKWLSEKGCECNKKLTLATFDPTGRGVLTRSKIKAGEELINLPLNLTINVTTILLDETFNKVFLENKLDCIQNYKRSVSFQALLAFYLVYLKSQLKNTKWYVYLESLPQEYTVPYFLPNILKCHLHSDILSIVTKQKDIVNSSFKIFSEFIMNSNLIDSVKDLQELFSMSEYEWAYFTVNTRCVYMDLSKIINFSLLKDSILELLNDNTNIALCPYLDMINHSASAANETKLILNKSNTNIRIKDLNESMLSEIRFALYTKNNIDAYKEVFICYGDSHNLKLVTEYGFFLPNNNLDSVPFQFDSVLEYLISRDIKLSEEQLLFINNHGLSKELYIDNKGLSFNLYALLMVVKCYYKQNANLSKKIYSSEHICSDSNSLNDVIMPFVKECVTSIKSQISNLENMENKCVILRNCIALMWQYVKILDMFIKC